MAYYRLLSSIYDLVGEGGVLRLPSYIFDVFVFDNQRLDILRRAQKDIIAGYNVLITGPAGTGKTALMAIILKNLLDYGFKIGFVSENVTYFGREHEEEGVVLFCDDISRISKPALRSLAKVYPRMIVATVRSEELKELALRLGKPPKGVFRVYTLSPMSEKLLLDILYKFADKEGITIDPEAANIVVSKAGNLPVYIWQLIRDLKIHRKKRLDTKFANRIPQGMLEYIDNILWSILDDHEDKPEILLTLMIMADSPRYELHQDLMNVVFAYISQQIKKGEINLKKALLNPIFDRVTRYLLKTQNYSFKLPHDSWADVLHGKSKGLISSDISRLNALFPLTKRREILEKSAKLCEDLVIANLTDEKRKESFYENIRTLGISIGKLSIGIIDIVAKGFTLSIKELEKEMAKLKKNTCDPASKLRYLAYRMVLGIRLNNKEMMSDAYENIEKYIDKLSPRDTYIINTLRYVVLSNPENAVYSIKKSIDIYDKNKIVEIFRLMLMHMPIENISDLVLAVYWSSPELANELFVTNNDELKYVLRNTSIDYALVELSDIFKKEPEFASSIFDTVVDILSEQAKKLSPKDKVRILSIIHRLSKRLLRLLTDIKEILLLSSNEIEQLDLEEIYQYLVALSRLSRMTISNYFTNIDIATILSKRIEALETKKDIIMMFKILLKLYTIRSKKKVPIGGLSEIERRLALKIQSLPTAEILNLLDRLSKTKIDLYALKTFSEILIQYFVDKASLSLDITDELLAHYKKRKTEFLETILLEMTSKLLDENIIESKSALRVLLDMKDSIDHKKHRNILVKLFYSLLTKYAKEKNTPAIISILVLARQMNLGFDLTRNTKIRSLLKKLELDPLAITTIIFAFSNNLVLLKEICEIFAKSLTNYFYSQDKEQLEYFTLILKTMLPYGDKVIKVLSKYMP